jgi:hypothetical protein
MEKTTNIKRENGKPIKVMPLIHYNRQANLPLTLEDKKLIWKWVGNCEVFPRTLIRIYP